MHILAFTRTKARLLLKLPSLQDAIAVLLMVIVMAAVFAPSGASAAVATRALLLSAGKTEPSYKVMRQQLDRLKVPYDVVDTIPTPITSGLLQNGGNGKYSMLILATGSLSYEQKPGVWDSSLTQEEWNILWAYARAFSIRTLSYYTFPTPEYGLAWTGTVTTNTTGNLTAAGQTIFSDVKATAQIPFTAYTYLATAQAGFTPWITTPQGYPLVGRYVAPDGRQVLVSTTDQSSYEVSSALLTPSMLKWVSKGVFTNWNVYLTMHVDDFLIGNEHWPNYTDEVRMTAADLSAVAAWQQSRGIRFDLAFNGEGFAATDPLSQRAKALASQFRWINHTWSHANLDGATFQAAYDEFRQNIQLAAVQSLTPFGRAAAVTGEHSGLTNPNVLAAAKALAISYLATDASRQPNPSYTANGLLLVPRYPTNIFTDVATRAEETARYNGIYGTSLTYQDIIDRESDVVLRHMLSGDPRPHFAHQINLAGDRILLDLLDATLTKFRVLSTKPIRQPTFTQIGQLLAPYAVP